MTDRTLILIDGENLVARYQAMLDEGRRPAPTVTHERDEFVWATSITRSPVQDIVRVPYFMTVVGNEQVIANLEDRIARTRYGFRPSPETGEISGFLCPRIFKKARNDQRNKSVDINVTIDALRHAFNRHVDRITLISGDGDYLPLVREVMRQGVHVTTAGLSRGLSPELRRAADEFVDLDPQFFVT